MEESIKKMYQEAIKAYNNAYAPYSKFSVGACLLLKDGEMITGCNVENASFGLTICAERNALFSAYAKGYNKEDIDALLIVAGSERTASPCGACRQVMSELMNKDCKVYLTNLKKDLKVMTVEELLPYSFNEDDLDV